MADEEEELTPSIEDRLKVLEWKMDALALTLGISFLSPEEMLSQTVSLVDGEKTLAEAKAHWEELGITEEEYAHRFCTCEDHAKARAAEEIGLPDDE